MTPGAFKSYVVQAFRPAVFVCICSAALSAQRGGRGTPGAEFAGPPQGSNAIPIVEVVGCLAQGENSTWMVTDATEPTRAAAGFAKPEDVKAAETKPLGALRFRLIGLVEMSPAEHRGHKVAVKGMLIKDPSGDRLNVTSLATVTAACTK
jgi:hypothetical protein